MKRAVFLDRDNTLIDNSGYLSDPNGVRLLPGAAEAIALLRSHGYHVVVVTNQSGVARGLFTEEQLAAVHQRMQELLLAKGTGVDAVYYCPFLETDEAVVPAFKKDSELRKPRPGMLHLAARELNLDLLSCWMVGDAERDVSAGRAAGCRTIRVHLPAGETTAADRTAADLSAASRMITSEPKASTPPAKETAMSAPEPRATTAVQNDALLAQIVDELRTTRQEARRQDFSMARLIGAVAQAFAVCALGWGLYATMEISEKNPGAVNDAVIRLLTAVVFQLMALTAFVSGRR